MDNILDFTGVAAFIALLGVIFQLILKNKNENITKERCKWRERLKELAVVIENGKKADVKKAITELKTRINSFGYYKSGTILEDSHIWEIIKDNNNIFKEEEKNKLVLYISLLLKHDWERCKCEVNHWCVGFFEIIGGALFLGISVYMMLYPNYPLEFQGFLIIIALAIFAAEMYFKDKKDKLEDRYINSISVEACCRLF